MSCIFLSIFCSSRLRVLILLAMVTKSSMYNNGWLPHLLVSRSSDTFCRWAANKEESLVVSKSRVPFKLGFYVETAMLTLLSVELLAWAFLAWTICGYSKTPTFCLICWSRSGDLCTERLTTVVLTCFWSIHGNGIFSLLIFGHVAHNFISIKSKTGLSADLLLKYLLNILNNN